MATKKKALETTDPRLVTRGTVVRSKSGEYEDVVRAVSVVLHLANGMSESYEVGTDVVTLGEKTAEDEVPVVDDVLKEK